MSADEQELIGHSYTRARKHPLVIGKLPGAGRLPGGPYTLTQIGTMVAMFVLLVMTRALWGFFGIANAVVLLIVPWGTAWLLRYARLDGRDPARAIRSLLVYASAPAGGRLSGRPQHKRGSRLAVGSCTVHVRTAAPEPAAAAVGAVGPVRAAAPVRAAGSPQAPQPAAQPQPQPLRLVPPAPAVGGRRGPGPRQSTGTGSGSGSGSGTSNGTKLQALLDSLDKN